MTSINLVEAVASQTFTDHTSGRKIDEKLINNQKMVSQSLKLLFITTLLPSLINIKFHSVF